MKIASLQRRGKIAPEKENQKGSWQDERYHKRRVVTNPMAIGQSNMANDSVGYRVSCQHGAAIGKQPGLDSISANRYRMEKKRSEA